MLKRVVEDQIRKLSHDGLSFKQVAKITGVDETTVFHLLCAPPRRDQKPEPHDTGMTEVPLFGE